MTRNILVLMVLLIPAMSDAETSYEFPSLGSIILGNGSATGDFAFQVFTAPHDIARKYAY